MKDDIDGCPEVAEDRDGFEDADGCPEIDDDDDGIPDKYDACPREKGPESNKGCPVKDAAPKPAGKDRDHDGIMDDVDRCPDQPEDRDGFQDHDGCPDPDNDHDGISDTDDACPNEPGERSADPARNGCPLEDADGDTILDSADKCPKEAETWNGVDDEDGCPDTGGKALVTIDEKAGVKTANPIKVDGSGDTASVDASSTTTLRAIATAMHGHPNWTLAVGVNLRSPEFKGKIVRVAGKVAPGQRLAVIFCCESYDVWSYDPRLREKLRETYQAGSPIRFYGELGQYKGHWQFVVQDESWVK